MRSVSSSSYYRNLALSFNTVGSLSYLGVNQYRFLTEDSLVVHQLSMFCRWEDGLRFTMVWPLPLWEEQVMKFLSSNPKEHFAFSGHSWLEGSYPSLKTGRYSEGKANKMLTVIGYMEGDWVDWVIRYLEEGLRHNLCQRIDWFGYWFPCKSWVSV